MLGELSSHGSQCQLRHHSPHLEPLCPTWQTTASRSTWGAAGPFAERWGQASTPWPWEVFKILALLPPSFYYNAEQQVSLSEHCVNFFICTSGCLSGTVAGKATLEASVIQMYFADETHPFAACPKARALDGNLRG